MWSSKKTWLCVVAAFAGLAAVVIFVMLQVHSGYSASFLGLWTPPNTDSFRQVMGIGALSALVISIAFAVLAVVRGRGFARWIAIVPATVGVLMTPNQLHPAPHPTRVPQGSRPESLKLALQFAVRLRRSLRSQYSVCYAARRGERN
jgi:hypothetical protein